ncbi:glycosyltransferase [Sporosarcina sp. Sa2YVA2]|uniref:Glycosyltransferase n=1 Tax=Sporosarcina quadrami TaxID=2762234 RepID=A0ABR8U981_9BACL|nr:glycosyltransferase [Sporosarcina quadrami]MBD7984582.1 glycosyltransferase [Sporosarcina quadrami]
MKNKVLILTGYYYPSIKAGGPVRSIINLVENLSNEFDFYIITSDRDLGDCKPYSNIEVDKWISVNHAKVYYTDPTKLKMSKLLSILKEKDYNVIYLNSFFSFKLSILPLFFVRMQLLKPKKIILAPRGQFSNGALGLKSIKKNAFIRLARFFRLHKNVIWHSTNILEKENIIKNYNSKIDTVIANNLTRNYKELNFEKQLTKTKGSLKIVYISRIHPMKNLLQALNVLMNSNDNITFNIFGPIEDSSYWDECLTVIKVLPKNITVNYNGIINNDEVNKVLKSNHVFFLLTLGENFGHAISEALLGGCPVIISDQTPWRNLNSENVGWDLSLENNEEISEKIDFFVQLSQLEYNKMSELAFLYGQKESNQEKDIVSYKRLFSNENCYE